MMLAPSENLISTFPVRSPFCMISLKISSCLLGASLSLRAKKWIRLSEIADIGFSQRRWCSGWAGGSGISILHAEDPHCRQKRRPGRPPGPVQGPEGTPEGLPHSGSSAAASEQEEWRHGEHGHQQGEGRHADALFVSGDRAEESEQSGEDGGNAQDAREQAREG